MKKQRRQSGLTLTELLVTMAVAAVLMSVAIPAAKRLTETMRAGAGTYGLIDAALSNARATAIRQQKYAGVRFQRAADGRTYLVFIVHDDRRANLFVAVEGRKPIALPEDVGVMDGFRVSRTYTGFAILDAGDTALNDGNLLGAIGYLENRYFEDASTFSIVFSPAGKIVRRMVWVRNHDGYPDPNADGSLDNVFNRKQRVDEGFALLYQDDYDDFPGNSYRLGIGPEYSRRGLIVYSKSELSAVAENQRWSGYLERLNPLMVSPYTGELIGE